MLMNEAETCFELISPVLREKGYKFPYVRLETPAPVEPIGHKGRRRKGSGRTDYLLCVDIPNATSPMPIAILEAKRESEDPLKGMQQAKGYAECDRFDAKYIFSTNGHRYAKFNKFTGEQTGPFPFGNFPDQKRLPRLKYNLGDSVRHSREVEEVNVRFVVWPHISVLQPSPLRMLFTWGGQLGVISPS